MIDLPVTSKFAIALRVAMFWVFAFISLKLTASLLYPAFGVLIASVMGGFLTGCLANALCMRIYERGPLADIGLHWNRASVHNFLVGVAGGAGAVAAVVGLPLALGVASWKPSNDVSSSLGGGIFLTVMLVFGAVGEEMFFRGYGFQILVPAVGPAATVLPMAVLFAAAHIANQSVTSVGLFNTFAWGVVLGWALLKSGDLWLPIGLHLGWNWALPLFGVNVSGFKMRMSGYALEWRIPDLWSGGAYGPEGGLLGTVVIGLLVAFLWKARLRPQALPLVVASPRQ